jgi:hypothetical protein
VSADRRKGVGDIAFCTVTKTARFSLLHCDKVGKLNLKSNVNLVKENTQFDNNLLPRKKFWIIFSSAAHSSSRFL